MFNKKSNSLQNIIDEDNRPITYITKRKIMSTSDFEVAPTDYKIETSSFNLKHDEESPLKELENLKRIKNTPKQDNFNTQNKNPHLEEDINTNPEPSPNYFVGKHVDETDLVNKQVFKEVSTYKKYTGKHRVEN